MNLTMLNVICGALLLAANAACGAEPAIKKILLIHTAPDHPHGTHMYEHECRLLAKCLEQTSGVRAEVSHGWPVDETLLDVVDCIVFYSAPAGEIVLGEAQRARFMELMKRGVGFVAIHWATGDRKGEPINEYLDVLGGAFNFTFAAPPLAVTHERLTQLDPTHPICRGWVEYELRDEWYLAMKFHPRARPLVKVRVRSDEKAKRPQPIDLTVAWAFERDGGGRSFGTTLGHFHDNFGIEAFRRMLVNGILWAANVAVPTLGAPVAVEDSDLILPPSRANPS